MLQRLICRWIIGEPSQVTRRIGTDQRPSGRIGKNLQQAWNGCRIALPRLCECISPANKWLALFVSIPRLHLSQGPFRVLILVAKVASIWDFVPDRIFRHRYAHRMVPQPRLQAHDRGRHVTLDAKAAPTLRGMMTVRGNILGDGGVAICTKRIVART